MQICTSYFYQVRFFKPHVIPLSTAMWDPRWYHDFKGMNHQFKDKNGVWNGLRAEPFVPGPNCNGECKGRENCDTSNPNNCDFLRHYREQLDKLNFNEIWQRFNRLAAAVKEKEGFEEEPILVLLVHETPDNPCSERRVIQDWFFDNGYPISELPKGKK